MNLLAKDNQILFSELLELLQSLDQEQYVTSFSGNVFETVGNHVRHVLEHYTLFLNCFENKRIDYDSRERVDLYASDLEEAKRLTQSLMERLALLRVEFYSKELSVKQDTGQSQIWCKSSIGRELQFLAIHHVHHLAMIRFILESSGVMFSGDFGLAPSTVKYREKV